MQFLPWLNDVSEKAAAVKDNCIINETGDINEAARDESECLDWSKDHVTLADATITIILLFVKQIKTNKYHGS